MYNGKTGQILQFDRKGKFVRQVSRRGNGPGEYGIISDLVVDDQRKELSIFQYGDLYWFVHSGEIIYAVILQ